MVDTKTITEATSEYIYTFDSEKYDDVLVIGTDLSGSQNVNVQIRFKRGNNLIAIVPISMSISSGTPTVCYKFVREKSDFYYMFSSKDGATTVTNSFITNSNYIGKKVNSVRVVAQSLTSGTFKIYAKIRSEFI